jgi:Raf kinase inhibitor-like YbhB/YbcL family protein
VLRLVLLALAPGLLVATSLTACTRGDSVIDLRSDAFREGGRIPTRYSCEGENLSPPLEWGDVHDEVQEFALVMADFGAEGGIFHHWIVTGIPRGTRSIAAGKLPAGAVTALTTSGNPGYVGPCPPPGERHEYVLTLFPLDRRLQLPAGTATKKALDAIDAARLGGEGVLRGTFAR